MMRSAGVALLLMADPAFVRGTPPPHVIAETAAGAGADGRCEGPIRRGGFGALGDTCTEDDLVPMAVEA
ncbi:MAG: hypothetical protein IT561_21575 [Alphaproteobacteria bacterium]|nr:hypothetical protein [Alphaproteobacteria bacterium]